MTTDAYSGMVPTVGGNWMLATWRLTQWNLFAARRRTMSKWLAGILLVGCTGIALLTSLSLSVSAQTIRDFCGGNNCQDQLNQHFFFVTFPGSVAISDGFTGYPGYVGLILLVILAGALVGSEYGASTIRLWLSRGVGRGQMIVSQALALGLIAFGGVAVMTIYGALLGFLLGPALGAQVQPLPSGGFGELVGLWLANSLGLYAFALLALFMATLARSTAAGIGLPLGYVLFEFVFNIVLSIFTAASSFGPNPGQDSGLAHLPDYFLGTNFSVLVYRAGSAPLTLAAPAISVSRSGFTSQLDGTHALVTVLIYCALFAGGAYLVLRRRDVTD
jgi:ABC-type transport system involved in multi-copper enzyme maturation permease subunit